MPRDGAEPACDEARRVNVALPADGVTHQRLKALAEAGGCSMGHVVAALVAAQHAELTGEPVLVFHVDKLEA